MENNIINTPTHTIIINGGNALPGCPEDWDQARNIEKRMNEGKGEYGDGKHDQVRWKFDCGFKLDFDGPLVYISSRFYPPKTSYGPTWDGAVTVFVLDQKVALRQFDCPTIEQLQSEVEAYVSEVKEKILNALQ